MTVNSERRDRRAAKRRNEIMGIAKEMFLSRSYAQVSVEEVAAAADLSKATVYKYFDSKLDIYSAIILSDAQDLVERIRGAFNRDQTVFINLRAMALAYVNFFLEHPEYFEKLSWFYLPGREQHLAPDVLNKVNLLLRSARMSIEQCLEEAIEQGELRTVDVKSTAIIIYSQWLGLSYLAVAIGEEDKLHPNYAGLIEIACDQQLNGLLAVREGA